MRRFIAVLVTVLCMAVVCARPCTFKAYAGTGLNYTLEGALSAHSSQLINYPNYIYYTYQVDGYSQHMQGYQLLFFNDNCTFTYENNILSINKNNVNTNWGFFSARNADTWTGNIYYDDSPDNSFSSNIISFNTDTLTFDGFSVPNACWQQTTSGCTYQIFDYQSNIEVLQPHLNLDIEFTPDLDGTISRQKTINGKSYTSDFLYCSVTNNGADAQIAWFIVPHGEDITFPTSIITDNTGYIGNPTFAYVRDEWTTFTVGFVGTSVYAPSVWHVIPSGYINQPFDVPWSSMKLQADKSYDVVFYATFNNNVDGYVQTDLTEVQEIYRSTFSITDPAEFNPNNEGFDVHSFDPDIDNTSLFTASSAFHDDNGNLVIRGQGTGIPYGSWSGINAKVNPSTAFGNFFNFFSSFWGYFPSQFQVLIMVGLSAIVVIGIIKVVSH